MKIVKEHIDEKFEETTDSVRDMHIGGIDLGKAWTETVSEGIRKWYVFLHDLNLLGKKVTVSERLPHSNAEGPEKTLVIKDIKRGNFPSDIYFYYDDDEGKEQRIMINVHKKLYIHDV